MLVDPAYTSEAQGDVRALGFDPYNELGPLDDRFRPGVDDSVGPDYRPARGPHEIDAASVLAREGADVRLVREDHTQQDRKSIDAYVRWHRADHGTGTEFKSLISANNVSRATKRAMLDGPPSSPSAWAAQMACPAAKSWWMLVIETSQVCWTASSASASEPTSR